jgi:hypothetical protein
VEGYGSREAGFGEENGMRQRRDGDGDWVIFIAVEVK